MRIRSLHPSYLDSKWLVALRRETLLAKHVLEWKTKGYTMHPQLERFKDQNNPLSAINYYLTIIQQEASQRNYNFDITKIGKYSDDITIPVTKWQIYYEFKWYCQKIQTRDPQRYEKIKDTTTILTHPLFVIIDGDIASWEKII
jgi:hypothetical protein